jgi:nucleoid-associated protein YgaU
MSQGKTEKATLYVVDNTQDHLDFLFNPTSYSVSKSAKWHRPVAKGAKEAAHPEYAGIDPASVQMEILFDSWESPGAEVSHHVEKLLDWLKATEESLSKTPKSPQPPVLAFAWGRNRALSWFHGYLKSVNVKYLMFRHDGAPTRATASITLEELPHDPQGQNPTSGGTVGHRTHVVTAGDSLQSIAHQEYGNAAMWRELANLNGIDDPLRVSAGTTLLIAGEDELAAAASGA